ncbi:MAG: TetR/AcrR family transcriptional regulator [Thermoguttaceae bacterium]
MTATARQTTSSRRRMTGENRRAAIVDAARRVFIERGFNGTTTKQLAQAAGVSEALLFKHFPSKEALYHAIQLASFEGEGERIREWLDSLTPSTGVLVFLVHDLVSHVLGNDTGDRERAFLRLVLRSLMEEGEFARLGLEGGPHRWVRKLQECIEAAAAAGDMVDDPAPAPLAGWLVHQLIAGILMHFLPDKPVIDYGVSRKKLVSQVTWFSLRGIGVKEEAIRRHYVAKGVYDV